MKRRLEGDQEVKREATGSGSSLGPGASPEAGLGASAAAMSDEMKHMVAALVAKELLAGLAPNSGGQGGARFGRVAFGDEQEATVNAFLHQKLGNDSLTRRPGPGGKRLTYIESCKAIELANRAFGFNGWSCHIIDCHEEYKEKRGDRWAIGFSSVVRIELKDGTSHEDVGFGTSDGQRDLGAAVEQAKKASISDARKRALRLFGEYLGNSCYDREHIKEVTSSRGVNGPPPLPSPSGVAQARVPPQPAQAQAARAQQQQQQPQQQQQQQQPQQPQQQYPPQPPPQPQQQRVLQQMQQPHNQQQQGQFRQPQPIVPANRGGGYSSTPTTHGLSLNTPPRPTATTTSSNSSPPLNAASVASRISAMHQQQQQQQPFQQQQQHLQTPGATSGGSVGPRIGPSTGEPRPSGPSTTTAPPPLRQPLHPTASNNAAPPSRMMSNVVTRSPFKLDDLTPNRSAGPAAPPGAGSAEFSVEDLSFSQFDYDPNTNENAKRMRT